MITKYNIIAILSLCIMAIPCANSQNIVSGKVQDAQLTNIQQARITLFTSDILIFEEERTDENGVFTFADVPPGDYQIGIAKKGKEYVELSITVPLSDDLTVTLTDETNPGIWETIVQSPEALGGTDMGVLMPDGRIYYCHSTKDPFYFDPVANDTVFTVGDVNIQGCVGPIQTEDSIIWFIGGTLQEVYGPGTQRVKTFDPATDTWEIKPSMLDYRWYPTLAMLPSGKFLIAGGGNLNNPQRTNTAEIYDPETGQSSFTDTLALGNEISPIVVLYDGRVLMTHRPPQLFDPSTNQWEPSGSFVQSPRLPNGDHSDCELVLMPDGEAIAVGYKTFTPGVYGSFIERYDPVLDSWSLGSSILPIRSRPKTCLLPDKKILVMGGYKEDTTTSNTNQWGYMKLTDLYDPASDSWRRLDDLNYFREYHALTILVPDGRVIAVGGEGEPGNEPPFSVIEAFKPPYLFRGVRPEINNVNESSFARGGKIELDFSKTDSVTEVILMSNAVVTHFMNSGNNRYLSLEYKQSGNRITASLPKDSVTLMPGFYMLFIMVDDIPSEGKIIHIKNEEENFSPGIGFLDSTFVWTEYFYFAGSSQSVKYTIDNTPTVFSGKTYYEVLRTFEELSENWERTYFYIRFENGIVYVKQNTDEVELFNFNLMVNDTFIEYFSGVPLIVDSVDTIMLLTGEQRKRLQLRCYEDSPGTDYYTEWIEGIGNLEGIFGQNAFCQIDGETYAIMCMFRNDTLIYDNPKFDSCWLLPVATAEINEESLFLKPNPASESINIGGLGNELKAVSIFNTVGRQVYQGGEAQIDLTNIPSGYYYAVIQPNDNQYVIKGFVKL
ncbi:MAG: DUF1929 domain-containing protein [Saprospiraceae bacterium]|nr:DUF1929 domain-containing protein [Saprospiraceae bacterium]